MRLTRTLGFAGALIAAALVGGALIGSAFATDDTTDTTDAPEAPYCDTFMDAFAAELGVTRDELTPAGRSAANAAIDAAVAAGDLTEERADAVRERIAEADGHGCGLFRAGWVRGFGHGVHRGLLGGDVLEAAADAFGLDSSQLIGQLREAGSLEEVAAELGVSYDDVKATILAAVRTDLEATDASEERIDAVIERLTTWLDNGGQFHRPGRWQFDRGPNDTDAEESGA